MRGRARLLTATAAKRHRSRRRGNRSPAESAAAVAGLADSLTRRAQRDGRVLARRAAAKVLAPDDDGVLRLHAAVRHKPAAGACGGGVRALGLSMLLSRLPLLLLRLALLPRPPQARGWRTPAASCNPGAGCRGAHPWLSRVRGQAPAAGAPRGVQVIRQADERIGAQLLILIRLPGGAQHQRGRHAVCSERRRRTQARATQAHARRMHAPPPQRSGARRCADAPLLRAPRRTLEGTSVRYSAGMIWSVSMFCD